MILHLDLDLVVYRVGHACEGKYWSYKGDRWENKNLLNKQLVRDGMNEAAVTAHKEPEDWENVKKSLVSFVDTIISHVDADDFFGYISGSSNFRHSVATILPYKGNRSSASRPFHYDNIRQFLVDVYDARMTVNMEADDGIGLAHDPEDDVIATVDKDLNCIPGMHYNWDKGSCFYVTETEANRNFFKQMLIGDLSTDNILGLYGVGESSILVKQLLEMEDPEMMRGHVFLQYQKRFGNYAEKFFIENAKLLWILQKRDCPIPEIFNN
jgi:hypothetical protein